MKVGGGRHYPPALVPSPSSADRVNLLAARRVFDRRSSFAAAEFYLHMGGHNGGWGRVTLS